VSASLSLSERFNFLDLVFWWVFGIASNAPFLFPDLRDENGLLVGEDGVMCRRFAGCPNRGRPPIADMARDAVHMAALPSPPPCRLKCAMTTAPSCRSISGSRLSCERILGPVFPIRNYWALDLVEHKTGFHFSDHALAAFVRPGSDFEQPAGTKRASNPARKLILMPLSGYVLLIGNSGKHSI